MRMFCRKQGKNSDICWISRNIVNYVIEDKSPQIVLQAAAWRLHPGHAIAVGKILHLKPS